MEDARANYIVEGNKSIKNGSVVTVKAISESGKETKYTFNIIKEAIKSTKSNIGLYVLASVISLFIGFGMGIVTPKVIEKLKPVTAGVSIKNVPKDEEVNNVQEESK
jgi:hypothetical protein